ncbi:Pycsar system effector family protein [Chitinophaga rhizophila]|uniref:Pycsar effector protein domain-containing protein n=1 Tax=Chitinophaga rhizophila TaxID=2866212 RepID=A0ABS7GJG1_9BACT|nr:Pycsar system effector family protein [Chitinophaga rhizophila]MBW8687260.1 hypothetical protein [Chitinophaga rhizophila]
MTTPVPGPGSTGTPAPNSNPNASIPVNTQASTTPPGTTPQNPVQTADHGERYWLILQNNVEWVRFSDSKAGLILTTYGVLFTIIYTNAKDVFTAVKGSQGIHCVVWLFALSSLASIISAFLAVRPRLKTPGDSILYFKHIYENNADAPAYHAKAKPILDDEEKYLKHLTGQIWSLSKVATNKYNFTGYSIYAFLVSLVSLVIMVIMYVHKILI